MYKYTFIYIHIKQRANLERHQMGMHGTGHMGLWLELINAGGEAFFFFLGGCKRTVTSALSTSPRARQLRGARW